MKEKIYSPRELMEYMGFKSKTNHTVHRLIKSGELKAIHLNSRTIRIRQSAVDEYFNKKENA